MMSIKKGLGLVESSGFGQAQLQLLGVTWYYNWGSTSMVPTSNAYSFVPMVFGFKSKIPESVYLLGFNEPDNAQQSNVTVSNALAKWPLLTAASKRLISPAMAGNPVNGKWLPAFLGAVSAPRVDAIAVHWYKGPDAKQFARDLTNISLTYGQPVWVSEFAPQTVSSAAANPTKYSQQDVTSFVQAATAFMESSAFVLRYAWHDAKIGTSALFDSSGALTVTGQAYADAASA